MVRGRIKNIKKKGYDKYFNIIDVEVRKINASTQ